MGYVSLSKNECESFAVSFYLCFLLQESHPDWDFEGNLRERSLLSHFPSNNVHSISDSKRCRTSVASRCVFNLSSAKVQHCHCGSRIFCQLFLIFFSPLKEKGVKTFHRNLLNDNIVLQCCSVAVLKKPFPYAKNSSISIYIDIEFISYFHTTIF